MTANSYLNHVFDEDIQNAHMADKRQVMLREKKTRIYGHVSPLRHLR